MCYFGYCTLSVTKTKRRIKMANNKLIAAAIAGLLAATSPLAAIAGEHAKKEEANKCKGEANKCKAAAEEKKAEEAAPAAEDKKAEEKH
jgi:hypothetical protein